MKSVLMTNFQADTILWMTEEKIDQLETNIPFEEDIAGINVLLRLVFDFNVQLENGSDRFYRTIELEKRLLALTPYKQSQGK